MFICRMKGFLFRCWSKFDLGLYWSWLLSLSIKVCKCNKKLKRKHVLRSAVKRLIKQCCECVWNGSITILLIISWLRLYMYTHDYIFVVINRNVVYKSLNTELCLFCRKRIVLKISTSPLKIHKKRSKSVKTQQLKTLFFLNYWYYYCIKRVFNFRVYHFR